MVEIDPRDWHVLPDVPAGRDSVNIDAATEECLDRPATSSASCSE